MAVTYAELVELQRQKKKHLDEMQKEEEEIFPDFVKSVLLGVIIKIVSVGISREAQMEPLVYGVFILPMWTTLLYVLHKEEVRNIQKELDKINPKREE